VSDDPGSDIPPPVPAGADREGERRSMGITTLAFKVASRDTGGALFVVEQTNHGRGGPPRHVHFAQEEWFYAVEGEFVAEVGGRVHRLAPGDSLLAPRNIPHVWAFVGGGVGRLLIAFTPAGQMEAFFRAVTATASMPSENPELWLAHGMRVVGPPLAVD
jgi:quercetin dioxygenase-like cupin family protein